MPTAFQKKQQRKKRTPKCKAHLDTRKPMQIYKSLLKMELKYEPLKNPVIGHTARMNAKSATADDFKRVVDVEMTDVDVKYLEDLRLWVKESGILQSKMDFKKGDEHGIKGEILRERCQRVVELAEMETLYERQQEVEKILSKMSFTLPKRG